jgi:crotonobetainyl-CoA:carnitine CoA-transferase CaiB-like acyl-CoA transferase
MGRLGIDYDTVRERNPGIIYASLSAFGQDGPYAQRPGVDVIVQALSGAMSMTGEPGRPPARMGVPVADLAGGMWTTIAILAALRARDQGHIPSTEIDISLLDGQIAMMPYFSAYYFLDGNVPGPQGSGGHGPLYAAFRCADEVYIAIAVYDQRNWHRLVEVMQSPQWQDDARFLDPKERVKHADELGALVGQVFAERPSNVWLELLQDADIPSARINRLDQALADEQVQHRNMVISIDHELGDTLRFVGTPIHMRGYEPRYESPPVIGGNTRRVLEEFLGVAEADSQTRERGPT